jgi:hypothetical protein
MSYETYRKLKIEGYYEHQLQSLLSSFNPNNPTVILLPGGMGSQLERTEYPVGTEPNVINDIAWVDLGIFWPKLDARSLEIEARGREERDKDSHVVAAHGPLKFLTQTPYEELKDYADKEAWNYFVFGYDWRRPLSESAEYFRNFIYRFQKEVVAVHKKNPMLNLTVVCHSMGGLVCTYALGDRKFSSLGFRAIVTVATPFYGTSTQQDRYFRGDEDLLNKIYGKAEVLRITASLPGPYTLMFLPKETYNRDGRRIGLNRYPEYDPSDNSDTDPYDSSMINRWPQPVKDHKQFLARARSELIKVAQPLKSSIVPAFFNVRSSLDANTAVELLWDKNPTTKPGPISGLPGPGDGTVPAWAAWHAYTRTANRYELKQAKDHGRLLEHPEVLFLINSIVKTRKLPTIKKRGASRAPKVANSKAVERMIDVLVKKSKSKQPLPKELFEKPFQRAIVSNLVSGKKPQMVGVRRRKS